MDNKERIDLCILEFIYSVKSILNKEVTKDDIISHFKDKFYIEEVLTKLEQKFEISRRWNDHESALYDSELTYFLTHKGMHRYLMETDKYYKQDYEEAIKENKLKSGFENYKNWLLYILKDPTLDFRSYCMIFDLDQGEIEPKLTKLP